MTEDIRERLADNLVTVRGPLARESLRLQVIGRRSRAERLAWLADHIDDLPGSGIIYALTKHDCSVVASWLRSRGQEVQEYHAGLADEVRTELEARLLRNDVKALVATVALGMGFDKPDLGFVVHYQSPGNLVAYYQQIGRAGRAIPDAIAVLFLGDEDEAISDWFIGSASPSQTDVDAVLKCLEEEPLSIADLQRLLNLRPGEIKKVLRTLTSLSAAPIVKIGSTYQRTVVPYVPDTERQEALAARRIEERSRFLAFAETAECLMLAVRRELDDVDAEPCGRCSNCVGDPVVPTTSSPDALLSAIRFLSQSEFSIEPRKIWQAGAFVEDELTGGIPSELRCEAGLCLSMWGDPGVATWVREDKRAGRLRDELVQATVEAIARSSFSKQLSWVCSVPSLRSGNLVPNFAERVAAELGLEYLRAVEKVKETQEQKSMQNSFYQARNLDGVFRILEVRTGSVLLIDDMVDSRWTFTVIGALIRRAGSGAVIPLALCSTSQQEADV